MVLSFVLFIPFRQSINAKKKSIMPHSTILQLLGDQSEYLLNHVSTTVDSTMIHATGPDVN